MSYPNLKYNNSPSFYNSYVDIFVISNFNNIYIHYDSEINFDSGTNYNPISVKLITSYNYNVNTTTINPTFYIKYIHINNNLFSLQYNYNFINQLQKYLFK